MRILIFFVLLFLAIACNSKQQKPLISGLLWGGEGSKLVVKPVGERDGWADTILINHLGEFEWTRDSIVRGFYRLENLSGSGLLFFLEKGSAVYIDDQYIDYPKATKITGSDLTLNVVQLENNSANWLEEINQLSKRTKTQYWIASVEQRQKLALDFDSVRQIYRDKAYEISMDPLVRFFALHQSAGNTSLFDSWTDRGYFFETDSALQSYKTIPEIKRFSQKVDSLRQLHLLNEKFKPGSKFPLLSFPTIAGDTISTLKFQGTPLYIEVWNPSRENNDRIHAGVVPILTKYRRTELEVYLIAIDTTTVVWKEKIRLQNLYFNNVIDLNGSESKLFNDLGILQLPTNFLVDSAGVVMGKNIWGNQLEEGIELLLKK